jgi:hypothetical protein
MSHAKRRCCMSPTASPPSLSPTLKGVACEGRPGKAAFDPAAWAALGLDEAVLAEILQEASLQAIEILSIINPGAAVIY